jgi:hypothetical protein
MVNELTPGEIVTVGPQGMAGIYVLLRGDEMPSRILVQVPGEGFRMRSQTFIKLTDQKPEVQNAFAALRARADEPDRTEHAVQ